MNEEIDLINIPKTPLELARILLEFAEYGDYSNGNVEYGVDEGQVMASNCLHEYRKVLEKFEKEQ